MNPMAQAARRFRPAAMTAFILVVAGRARLPAQGGPPLRTDDPGTPGDGVWEVNVALTVEKLHREATFEAPLLDVNYGVGERTQIKFEIPWIFLAEEGEEARNGLGKSNVGLKWRFLDQDPHGIDVSVYPQLEFENPTSSAERGLVEEGTEIVLPLQARKGFGALSFNVELGYVVLEEEDELLYGLAAGLALREDLELLGELHGSAESDFGDDQLTCQLGLRWAFGERFVLLAAAGSGIRSFEDEDVDLIAYVGIQVLLGAGAAEPSEAPRDEP